MNCLSSVKYIQAIADAKSISAAADKLEISQPALSAQLKKLEEQLGTVLFDRSKHPLELTEAGEIYLMYARRQQNLNREFHQHMSDFEDMTRGHLAIGGAGAFNISYFPKAVAAFSSRYPGIEIEIVDGNIPDIATKAVDGQIDLFISPPWHQDDRVQYEKLLEESIFICVPPGWSINDELKAWRLPEDMENPESFPQVDFTVFRECPFVILKEDQHIGHIMAALFRKYGFEPQKHIRVEQTMTSYGLTLAGAGISLMTESTIRNSGFKEIPALYMADTQICRREIYIAYPKQKYLSKAAKTFMGVLKDTFANS